MALYFPEADNQLIPGSHGVVHRGSWELNVQRTRFFGLSGESEIGGAGSFAGRVITFEHWLHGAYTDILQIGAALEFLERLVGTHGTLLAFNSTLSQRLENCTFDAFRMRPDRGVFFSPSLGWMTIGHMEFRQIAPNSTATGA